MAFEFHISYTPKTNLDDMNMVIDQSLVTETDCNEADLATIITADDQLISKWDYVEYTKMQVRMLEDKRFRFAEAIKTHMDTEAVSKGYDSILSAVSYANTTGPFNDEGISFLNWRDAVYVYTFNVLAQVEAGDIPEPTLEEFIPTLPARVLPEA